MRPFNRLKVKIKQSSDTNSSGVHGITLKVEEYLDISSNVEQTILNGELKCDESLVTVKSANELLHLSCSYGDCALISYALALNAEKNSILEPNDITTYTNDKLSQTNGHTPLIKAVHSGSIVAVELLLLNGVKLNTCDFNGQTALHHATVVKDLK